MILLILSRKGKAMDRDRTSGSVDVLEKAAVAVRAHLDGTGTEGLDSFLGELGDHYPSMALLRNLVSHLQRALPMGSEEVRAGLDAFERDLLAERRDARDRFTELVRTMNWKTAVTYSRSAQVRECLAAAFVRGLRRVLLSESRPAMEGLLLAGELQEEGLEITVTADAALPSLLPTVDFLVVGSDAFTGDFFTNKVGTGVLVREANRLGVPVVVLGVEGKRLEGTALPAWKNVPLYPIGEGDEFLREGDTFERVPWDLVGHPIVGESSP